MPNGECVCVDKRMLSLCDQTRLAYYMPYIVRTFIELWPLGDTYVHMAM
jgi:hypothetical protein